MDPLGKKGEEALEGVQNLSQRLENVESHLAALDNALQDFSEQSQEILSQEQDYQGNELEALEKLADKNQLEEEEIEDVKEDINYLKKRQDKIKQKVDKVMDKELLGTISRVRDLMGHTSNMSKRLRKDVNQLEERVDELENDFLLEMNKREYDFDQKLDASEFEAEKERLYEEIRKLRMSTNVLAEELDKKEEIEIDN